MLKQYRNTIKKGGALVLTIGLIAGLSLGCQSNAYEQYRKAEEKTEAANTAVYDMTIKMESDVDTSQMTEEQLKSINYLKQFEFKGKTTEDKTKNAMISDAWVNLGGIGFDFTYYGNGDTHYIKYPVLKKYINLETLVNQTGANPSNSPMPTISDSTKKALSDIWSQLATRESVKSVGDVIIATDSGDIKAKHMVIDVPGDAIKKAMTDSQKIIFLDPSIQKMMQTQLEKIKADAIKNGSTEAEINELTAENLTLFDNGMNIESYTLSCDIDADGYIVQEGVELVMSGFEKDSPLKSMTFHMNTVFSSLDKPVTLEFPEITADQVFTTEELNQQMPSVFKDLIQ